MSDNFYDAEYSGDTAIQDELACNQAMRVLQQHYPNHPWLVGCDHFAGMVHCRLLYSGQKITNNGYGFMLKLSTIFGPDGDKRIVQAGGECLERFDLARNGATPESALRAYENGLDLSNLVTRQ